MIKIPPKLSRPILAEVLKKLKHSNKPFYITVKGKEYKVRLLG